MVWFSQALVAHTCNPSYTGRRDQEDHGSEPDQANSLQDPIRKKSITKRAGRVAQGLGPEFKLHHTPNTNTQRKWCGWIM
jgi:hypothetical protein